MSKTERKRWDPLPVFIPIDVRLNLISLFNQHENRVALCNIALLYSAHFDQQLNVEQFGCLNMDQLIKSMKHLFNFTQEHQVIFVNCCISLSHIKLTKSDSGVRIDLNCLDELADLFEANDFIHLNAILQQTAKLNQPISITQFEQVFIENSGKGFNYLKYGFQSSADFFLTFSKLFTFTSLEKNSRIDLGNHRYRGSVCFSLGNIFVQLKIS